MTYILPPQFLLHNGIRDMPTRYPFGQLRRLSRVVLDRLLAMRRRCLEPEISMHFSVDPKGVRDTADESKRRRAWAGLPIGDDLLNEPLVFRRLAIIQRRVFYDLAGRKPNKGMRRK